MNRVVNIAAELGRCAHPAGWPAQRRVGLYDEAVRTLDAAVRMCRMTSSFVFSCSTRTVNSRPPKWFEAESFLKQTRTHSAVRQRCRSDPRRGEDVARAEGSSQGAEPDPRSALSRTRTTRIPVHVLRDPSREQGLQHADHRGRQDDEGQARPLVGVPVPRHGQGRPKRQGRWTGGPEGWR